ncbi:hypothetical protein [Vibrio agarilyticus]|uniref:hypothetical protein n=1 Tax=Vibrio agarilyticus TaxID=2726741 RepID=UPI001FE3044D|nr:hypothetical protein [Vibrio agarilyticus]
MIDIRDVAAVAVCALTQMGHKNKTYQLTGPESLSFAEQASILSAAVGYSIDYVPISREDAEIAMKAAGINDWLAQRLAEIMAWFAEGDYSGISQDVATVLGRPPRQFEAFAKEVAPLFSRD